MAVTPTTEASPGAGRALWVSTAAFTVCFAVWTIFSIIGLGMKDELGLSETQFGLLVGTPILTGSLSRLVLGIWADQYGGRRVFAIVMALGAAATFLLSFADTYLELLLAALGVGIAGGSFAVGVAYVSKFYPQERQGTALGIFGAGNVGSAVTKFLAPFVMVAMGWQTVAQLWAAALLVMAVIFWFTTREDPDLARRRAEGVKPASFAEQLRPLANVQVWRFSLYYFFVFGAFVALALWLPRYLVGVYGLDVKAAGMLAAFYSIPASLFRIYGGRLSDRFGARKVLYWTFGVSALCTFMLSYPPTDYVIHGIQGPIAFSTSMGLVPFVVTIFVLGFFMSLGKAAVFRHIPVYYPQRVGAVGGVVGMVGGVGGFVLPLVFGVLNDLTGVWTSCFFLLFLLVSLALAWMHFAVRRMEAAATAPRETLPELPEMAPIHDAARVAPGPQPAGKVVPVRRPAIADWRPEDPVFWQASGRRIARRNLWISTYCLLLAFAVWMVWSVVVARLPAVGFQFTPDQLFWLAALPGISGAALRIFYAFLVPVFGGRLWTAMSTASLLIPAFGIGYAVQDPSTPYLIFVVLALLCGLGGGNFASSMANISFFFPKAEKGSALALNAGLGNLGVSVMQFVVPVAVTMSIFGILGGEPQTTVEGDRLWMQNAGFLWVPFVIAGAVLAWLGMDDLASAKSSFAEQASIFQRRHTWLMCWLYTGTFGSFIGFSAGFPLLARLAFPDVDSLRYVFLGPLVGAASRAATGWLADRYGGARITFLVFLGMIAAVGGMLWFLNAGSFWGFFAMVMLLFFFSGVGNASTFQMIPAIWRETVGRAAGAAQADREAAAVIGFTSAIAAFGAFFIPKAYGASIAGTGAADAALWGFLAFYAVCAVLTFAIYSRPGGLLHAVERRQGAAPAGPTALEGSR
ncbi:Nitrate transporter [Phenylobacterium zucineum HLK1]|uniref:Nitrate transporter n=1 Tax=Phenylobacterium zucineum (strain HLK1) TaxID=450851 RepID=B4RFL7_PHEZH|nr:MFS transporter [Phenylobacterium zucineum]ACG77098.1 Nitrate transporter [Phenylobacterium zucineum HLK1]